MNNSSHYQSYFFWARKINRLF